MPVAVLLLPNVGMVRLLLVALIVLNLAPLIASTIGSMRSTSACKTSSARNASRVLVKPKVLVPNNPANPPEMEVLPAVVALPLVVAVRAGLAGESAVPLPPMMLERS